MKTSFSTFIEFPDETEQEIEFECEFSKSGIGAYEFWGAKCYDAGSWEIDNIDYDPTELTKEQCIHIEDLIKKGELDSKAWESLENN